MADSLEYLRSLARDEGELSDEAREAVAYVLDNYEILPIGGRDEQLSALHAQRAELEERVVELTRANEDMHQLDRELTAAKTKLLEWEATGGDLAKSYDALKQERDRISSTVVNLRESLELKEEALESREEEIARLRDECRRYRENYVSKAILDSRVAELEALREQLKGSGPVVDRFNAITQDLVKQLQNAGDRYRATIPGNMLDRVDKLERWSQFTENRLVGLGRRVSALEDTTHREELPTLDSVICKLQEDGLGELTNGELAILKHAVEQEVRRGQ